MKTAVCTICSNNYLHFARTLMQSLAEAQPDWDRYVLLVDENRGLFDPSREPFTLVTLAELPIPNPRAFCFRYAILELNTAMKPWIIEHLFAKRDYDRVVYLDPDIRVYRPLAELEHALDAGAFMVLTPHLTGPLDDELKPCELEIIQAGTYNLGFIALHRRDNTLPFLKWWQSKVEYDCVVDHAHGLFVDQKWMDLAPGMWDGVTILRHPSYNVAYWNLKHREVTRAAKKRPGGAAYLVNGEPLAFFHFSGLDPLKPGPFSKHQDRYSMSNLGTAREIVEDYCARVIANGLETCRQWPYAFGSFSDGSQVFDVMRQYYRKHLEPEHAAAGDPFDLGHDFFHQPWRGSAMEGPLVTILMRAIWEARQDLQDHFPDLEGSGRWDYAYWFSEEVAVDFRVPACCTDLVRRSLYEASGPGGARPRKPFWNPFFLMRWGRKVLPRRTQRRMFHMAHPVPGQMAHKPSLLRRIARRLPDGMKRRIKAVMMPKPWTPPRPPRRGALRRRGPAGLYYMGFFDEDPSAAAEGRAWMGTDASVRIAKHRPGTLRVSGDYDPERFRQAGLSARTVLRATLDGRPLGDITLDRTGPFEMTLPFPATASPRSATLLLAADQTFVPAEIGLGDDRRKLSVRIASVTLDDTVVLDFSRLPAAYMPDTEVFEGSVAFNLVGYLHSEMGVGESARLCAAAADAAGLRYSLFDCSGLSRGRADDDRLSHRVTNSNPHPVNLFHVNADQTLIIHQLLSHAFFEDRYNIGFWHWELSEFPEEWVPAFNVLQEVWVPTRFVQDAVAPKSPVPVVRMPHAVAFTVSEGLRRADLGLPENTFLFLMMYDMHSYQGRKNPEAVVEAFRRAFPDPRGVGIVIKTMNTASHPDEWNALEKRLRETPGVVVLNRTLSRQETYNLEALCDSFASLHRSEGFGLGLAESMSLGKPVIGTHWSGNVDFMDETNSCPVKYRLVELDRNYGPYKKGQRWADPDIDHAAWYMRRLVEDAEFRRRIADAGRRTILLNFSRKVVGEMYRRRLEVIAKLL